MKDRQGFFRIALHHSDEDDASFFYSKDSAVSEISYIPCRIFPTRSIGNILQGNQPLPTDPIGTHYCNVSQVIIYSATMEVTIRDVSMVMPY